MKKGFLSLCLCSLFCLVSCKNGVDVDSGFKGPTDGDPDGLSLVLPGESPFYTNDTSVVVSGVCQINSRVRLRGDETSDIELFEDCTDNSFSFDVALGTDKTYTFELVQLRGGATSSSLTFNVVKKTSVSKPALTFPLQNPFSSASTNLTVTGTCETGSTIETFVDSSLQSTTCVNSTFSSDISKFSDGSFPVLITQRDLAGNEATTDFIWTKQDLTVTPDKPQIVVDQSQIFSIEGGTPPYDVVFVNNLSGALFDSTTLDYQAGTISGVVDEIEITDALNFKVSIEVTVLPDVADRFEYPLNSGNFQNSLLGMQFLNPFIAKVVDKYGNAVPNYNVVFKKTGGDFSFENVRLVTTDAQGNASILVDQGYSSIRSNLVASSFIGPLPDTTATGRRSLTFTLNTSSNNTGNLGLDFPVGNGAENTLVDLLNDDAFEDLMVLNKGSRTIDIYLGDSSGVLKFSNRITGLCSSPSSFVGGDFNEDGYFDIVLTCSTSSFYYVFEGIGTGAFLPSVSYATDVNEVLVLDVFAAHLNSDAFLDLAFVSASSNQLSVRYGVGDGSFQNPTLYGTLNTPVKVFASDIDQANGLDLLVLNSESPQRVQVYLNNGSGLFFAPNAQNTHFVTNGASSFTVDDVTADASPDFLVVNNIENKVETFINNGDGTFGFPIDTPTGSSPTHALVYDYNGDTHNDLMVSNINDNTVGVYSGNGNGSFNLDYNITTKLSPISVNKIDVNSDSADDLLVVSSGDSEVQIYPNDGNGQLGLQFEADSNPVDFLALDYNNDGIRDKAVLSQSIRTLKIYQGNNRGQFSLAQTLTFGLLDPVAFISDDFDSDGFDDFAILNASTTSLVLYMNNAGAGFTALSPLSTGTQPHALVSGDFDSDGDVDIAVTNSGSNTFSTFLNSGAGIFQNRVDLATGAQPLGIQVADMNLDSHLDIILVTASDATNNLSIFNGIGDGTFTSSPSQYTAESSPTELVVGYFNTDALLDVAVLNSISASISVFLAKNGGGFQPASSYFAGSEAKDLITADIDGDSDQDLIVANGVTQNVRVLYGIASGLFPTDEVLSSGLNAQKLYVDDYNNDGAVDLSVLGFTSGVIRIYLGH